jgi:hypothetical protein
MLVSFREIATVGLEHRGFYLFSDPEQLHQVELDQNIPPIDWTTQLLIGVSMGSKPTGGFQTVIQKIERNKQEVWVHLEEKRPRPGRIVIQSWTFPGLVVAVPRIEMPSGPVSVGFLIGTVCEHKITMDL